MNAEKPLVLYRGICISYEQFKQIEISGVDLVPPVKKIDDKGRPTVGDGNEYGVYMTDNENLALNAYGDPNSQRRPIHLLPRSFDTGYLQGITLPTVGVVYKIDAVGLDVKKPSYGRFLYNGQYNNGFLGDEWITPMIPQDHYEIERLRISDDFLHSTQDIVSGLQHDDVSKLKEKTVKILEERKKRLEYFAEKVKQMTLSERMLVGSRQNLYRDIYGENGVHYLDEDSIDYSTTNGYIQGLLLQAYRKNPEKLEYKTLDYIERLKGKTNENTSLEELVSMVKNDGIVPLLVQNKQSEFIDKVDDISELRSKLQASTERYRRISNEIEELMKRNAVTPIPNYEEQLQDLINQRTNTNSELEYYRYVENRKNERIHKGTLNQISRVTGKTITSTKGYKVDSKTGVPIEIPKDKVELAHELGEIRNKLDEAMQNGIIDMQTCVEYKRFIENEYHNMQKDAPYHQKEQQSQYSPQTQELINQAEEVINQPSQNQPQNETVEYVEVQLETEHNPTYNVEQQVSTNPFGWTDEELEADFDPQELDPNYEDIKPKVPFENDEDEDYEEKKQAYEEVSASKELIEHLQLKTKEEIDTEQLEHSHGRIM